MPLPDAKSGKERDSVPPTNDLSTITAALLLTADCMGTGILALSADVQTLGVAWGIAFLVANLPINLYAGTILSNCASFAEHRILNESSLANDRDDADCEEERRTGENEGDFEVSSESEGRAAATKDFVGLTSLLFDEPLLPTEGHLEAEQPPRTITYHHPFTKTVLIIYYTNIFLVLGNYILVMSHAVDAMVGEDYLCLPVAGAIASILMFLLSQLRTMANLGRSVSAISLLALLIVVVQCLVAQNGQGELSNAREEEEAPSYTETEVALAKMSSLASIAFAVGSQKLLLNIRHEMADRKRAAPASLSMALLVYGSAYTVVCLLAGDDPPSFLFDSIPAGLGRNVAGLLLWIHVSVSYAINSQALCSSLDRLIGHRLKLEGRDRVRWALLTALVSYSSYLVANAVPFFKDLVALCGALTSIPLTLLLPAIFHRRVQGLPLCFPTLHGNASLLLVVFSLAFIAIGLVGAIGSIGEDWASQSTPFACH